MGQIHFRKQEITLEQMLHSPNIVLVEPVDYREEQVDENGLEYRIRINSYKVLRTIRGGIEPGAMIEVYSPQNRRNRQFANDFKRGISRHAIELSPVAPDREYPFNEDRLIIMLGYEDDVGIYNHKHYGLTLAEGWEMELRK